MVFCLWIYQQNAKVLLKKINHSWILADTIVFWCRAFVVFLTEPADSCLIFLPGASIIGWCGWQPRFSLPGQIIQQSRSSTCGVFFHNSLMLSCFFSSKSLKIIQHAFIFFNEKDLQAIHVLNQRIFAQDKALIPGKKIDSILELIVIKNSVFKATR